MGHTHNTYVSGTAEAEEKEISTNGASKVDNDQELLKSDNDITH